MAAERTGGVRPASPPGAHQVIFVGSAGCIYKLELSGKIDGEIGNLGGLQWWFDWIHALALSGWEDIASGREVN